MGLGGQAHTLEDDLDMMEDDLDMMEDDPKMYKRYHYFKLDFYSFISRSSSIISSPSSNVCACPPSPTYCLPTANDHSPST